MTINITRPVALGLAALLIVVVAVGVVLHRRGGGATVAVAPLSAQDRKTLVSSKALVDALPEALAQVPAAGSDASHGRRSPAQVVALIRRTPALASLSEAIANPTTVTKQLTVAYDAVVAGHSPGSVDDLGPALGDLQSIEGQIAPAIRLAAAKGGTPPDVNVALTALEADQKVRTLASLLNQWQQLYGAFILVEQKAAGS